MKTLLEHLGLQLGIERDVLRRFIYSAPHRYKQYSIPKRKPGSFRKIAQPSKELKVLQTEGVKYLQECFEIHQSATAYISGKGIKDNIAFHVRNEFLLKMDFANFFPSIKPADLLFLVSRSGITLRDEAEMWSRLFFFKPTRKSILRLSIGAPSSPFISNAVMIDFDIIVSDFCKSKQVSYSRYADDITFSTNKNGALFTIPEFITTITKRLDHPRLRVNKDKTVFSSKKHNRHVTGLVITNDGKISLGRSRKRMISAMMHKKSLGILSESDCLKLNGLLSFAYDVEPDFFHRVLKKYRNEKIRSQ